MASARDAWELLDHGFNGVAIGETLLKSRRVKDFIKEIRSQRRTMADPFAGDFGRPFQDDFT